MQNCAWAYEWIKKNSNFILALGLAGFLAYQGNFIGAGNAVGNAMIQNVQKEKQDAFLKLCEENGFTQDQGLEILRKLCEEMAKEDGKEKEQANEQSIEPTQAIFEQTPISNVDVDVDVEMGF